MLLAVPEALLPSELSGHCFVVGDPQRPAREENLVFIRTAPAGDEGQAPGGIRCLTVGRFVVRRAGCEDDAMASDLLEAVDQIVPGVASDVTADQIGLTMVGAVAGLAAAHSVARYVRGKRQRQEPTDEAAMLDGAEGIQA